MGAEADAPKVSKSSRSHKESHKEGHKESHKEDGKERKAEARAESKAESKAESRAEPRAESKARSTPVPSAPSKEKGKAEKAAAPDKAPVAKDGGSRATPVSQEKPRAAAGAEAPRTNNRPLTRCSEGLTEEVLTQIAQAKLEAQEEKLRDVVRFSMGLLREFPKLSSADRAKKVAEVQKALMKYEMQCIRAWAFQEERRAAEMAKLEQEAERWRKAAAEEDVQIVELRKVLENEVRRRERYEAYEEKAREVNLKRTRDEYMASIADTEESIRELKRRRAEHEALIEERTQRAQMLVHAVAELKQDLMKESNNLQDILKGSETGSHDVAGCSVASGSSVPGQVGGDPVEVLS